MEELLREQRSAKKQLYMDEADREVPSGAGAEAKGQGEQSKRKRKEKAPPKESARTTSGLRSRRGGRNLIRSMPSHRQLRETRRASLKPISSVLDKIRLRKMEVLKPTGSRKKSGEEANTLFPCSSAPMVPLGVDF